MDMKTAPKMPATKQEYESAKNEMARLEAALEDLFKRIEPGLAPAAPIAVDKEPTLGVAPMSETAANFARLGKLADEMTARVMRVIDLCDL